MEQLHWNSVAMAKALASIYLAEQAAEKARNDLIELSRVVEEEYEGGATSKDIVQTMRQMLKTIKEQS